MQYNSISTNYQFELYLTSMSLFRIPIHSDMFAHSTSRPDLHITISIKFYNHNVKKIRIALYRIALLIVVSFLCIIIYLKIVTTSIALKMTTYEVETFANIFYYCLSTFIIIL